MIMFSIPGLAAGVTTVVGSCIACETMKFGLEYRRNQICDSYNQEVTPLYRAFCAMTQVEVVRADARRAISPILPTELGRAILRGCPHVHECREDSQCNQLRTQIRDRFHAFNDSLRLYSVPNNEAKYLTILAITGLAIGALSLYGFLLPVGASLGTQFGLAAAYGTLGALSMMVCARDSIGGDRWDG